MNPKSELGGYGQGRSESAAQLRHPSRSKRVRSFVEN
jgi:hypothetical protein